MERLKHIESKHFENYNNKQPITLIKHFNKLKKIGSDEQNFDFYFSNSAVYSSMIEGNKIDFDSYLKYHYSKMNNTGKSFKEIEDLKKAYSFAKENKLSFNNLLRSHEIMTSTILDNKKYRGKIRDKDVFIFSEGLKIYTGAEKSIVKQEMLNFFNDIEILLSRKLSINQVFYFASMLHLKFVHIHPFADGNGRCSRLIEKWFLAEKLGIEAWFIQSEKLYQTRIKSYYKNVNLGNDYKSIDYNFSLPFLLMLPMSLRLK